MSAHQVTLPSREEMQKRLKKLGLPPQVESWLLRELSVSAGKSLHAEGVVGLLSVIINGHPSGMISVLVWERMPDLIDVLIAARAARKVAKTHLAKINQQLDS